MSDMDFYITFVEQNIFLFGALIILLILLIRTWVAPAISGIKSVNVQEAVRMMNNDDTVVVDVRLDREYANGHISDSLNIPVGALDARLRELEAHKDKPVLVSCQSGNRSMHGAKILRKQGFQQVFNLTGGMNAWINANMPVSTNTKKSKKRK